MPDKTVKVPVPGVAGLHDAVEVPVTESTERWTDIQLGDGTVIRVKPVVLGALRIENQWDAEGNPLYQLKINQVMTATSPDHLKKGASGSTTH